MKNKCLKISLISLFIFATIAVVSIFFFIRNKPYVIILNNYAAGRLGDQIIGYSKAKWLSHKYNIPFRLIPFKYCESLNISKEQDYTGASYFLNRVFYKLFGQLVWVHSEEDLVSKLKNLKRPTRFVAHINTRLFEHIDGNAGTDKYDFSWVTSVVYELVIKYPEFGAKLKKMLEPIKPLNHMSLPKDRITIAVHIRKGGGFDPQLLSNQYYNEDPQSVKYEQFYVNAEDDNLLKYASKNISSFSYDLSNRDSADKIYLDKFPPEQYYVKQIQNISNILDDAPIYVYIFTDDRDPAKLTARIKKATNKSNIIFDYRTEENSHDTNVIYDMYAMADFDCLIRSGSCFAYISQIIGNHKIIVYPLHLKWTDDKTLFVDKIGVIVRTKELSQKKFGS